ncbi:MAG: flagellin [Novosphingopyxis baekryungensis]|jgi:flagellar hook-associated protein 3 FlgL|nr:flagellin [Novosphingopyxis baekryungensis]
MVQSINRSRPREAVQRQLDVMKAIADQQAAISSGKKLVNPSDDPQGWLEISQIAVRQGNDTASVSNISRAETRAVQAESSMVEIANGLTRAKELIVLANNEATNGANQEGIAIELEGILANMQDIMGQEDPFGGPLFGTVGIGVPIGSSRNIIASPTLAALSENISDGEGGLVSITQIMQNAINVVRTGTITERQKALSPLDNALGRMTETLTEQGVVRGRLDSARAQFDESRLVLAQRRKDIEEVDITEAITRLQALDISLQAAQAVYAKINSRSLMDFLR